MAGVSSVIMHFLIAHREAFTFMIWNLDFITGSTGILATF